MDVMDVLPPLVARRVNHIKFLNTEREVDVKYLEERAVLEMKYLYPCKTLFEERGNVVNVRLDDDIERIHKEGGGKKEVEGSKGDDDGSDDDGGDGDVGEVEEREGATSLEDASDEDEIYGAIASGQGTTTTINDKSANGDDDEEGRMVGIPHFWLCAMGHMEAVVELITKRDI